MTNISWAVVGILGPFKAGAPSTPVLVAPPLTVRAGLRTVTPPAIAPSSPWASAVALFTAPTVSAGIRADVGGGPVTLSYVLQLSVWDGCSASAYNVSVQVKGGRDMPATPSMVV